MLFKIISVILKQASHAVITLFINSILCLLKYVGLRR